MFTNYESLICERCGSEFTGRKSAEDGVILCPVCIRTDEIAIFRPADVLSLYTMDEIIDGRGDDE